MFQRSFIRYSSIYCHSLIAGCVPFYVMFKCFNLISLFFSYPSYNRDQVTISFPSSTFKSTGSLGSFHLWLYVACFVICFACRQRPIVGRRGRKVVFQLEREAFVMDFGVFSKLELCHVIEGSSEDVLTVIWCRRRNLQRSLDCHSVKVNSNLLLEVAIANLLENVCFFVVNLWTFLRL